MPVEPNHDMDLKQMVKDNLELTREIHTMTKKIKHHITFQKIVSFIYLVIIILPIVLSIIYLPPLLKPLFEQYQQLLGPGSSGGLLNNVLNQGAGSAGSPTSLPSNLKNIDINKLPPELQKLLQQKK